MDVLESNVWESLKSLITARNQVADAFFYDVGALTWAEVALLNPWVDRKGSIVVVSPRASGNPIRHYPNALRFLIDEGHENGNVQAIAVAGVGSSVLGTAALARNVADACGFDVAGVVSGYGLADLVQEGMGGWFYYGAIDRFRYQLQADARHFLAALEPVLPADPAAREAILESLQLLISPLDAVIPGDLDTAALHDLLLCRFLFRTPEKLRLLVGHSKGNLLISYILNHMVDELQSDHGEMPRGPFNNMAVVTLGAVADIPEELFLPGNVHQFLGEWDWLGAMNSNRDLGAVKSHAQVPAAGHHLNSGIPLYLSAPDVLKKVTLPDPPPRPERPGHGNMVLGWRGPLRGHLRSPAQRGRAANKTQRRCA